MSRLDFPHTQHTSTIAASRCPFPDEITRHDRPRQSHRTSPSSSSAFLRHFSGSATHGSRQYRFSRFCSGRCRSTSPSRPTSSRPRICTTNWISCSRANGHPANSWHAIPTPATAKLPTAATSSSSRAARCRCFNPAGSDHAAGVDRSVGACRAEPAVGLEGSVHAQVDFIVQNWIDRKQTFMASGNWNRAWSGALGLLWDRKIIALVFPHQGEHYKFITSSCTCMKRYGSASVTSLKHCSFIFVIYK